MNIQQALLYFSLLLLMIPSMQASSLPIAKSKVGDAQTISGRKFGFTPETTVRISNNLEGDLQLTVHCKSKDNDLGAHVLANKQSYEWKFHVDAIDSTLFFCGLTSIEATGSFKIYEAGRDEHRCPKKCSWSVHKDGVHGFKEKNGMEDIFLPWPKLQ